MKNSHRMFLQSLMSKGIMNAKDTFTALKSSCEKYEEYTDNYNDDQRRLLIDFVHQINDRLRPMGMEIKKGVDELSGAGFYGIVNMTENSITLHASHYSENELQFFKNLLELIVLSDNGCIGSIAAMDVTDKLQKKMSKSDASNLLDKLEAENWIGKNDRGKIYLAARCIMEMEQYIFDMFGEHAVRCFLCKKLCVQGHPCDNCDIKLHHYCFKKLFKDKPEKKCPECRKVLSDEQASTSIETLYDRRSADPDHDPEEDNEDTDKPVPSSSGKQTRKRKAPK